MVVRKVLVSICVPSVYALLCVLLRLAPPNAQGAWSIALVLWLPPEYYYYYYHSGRPADEPVWEFCMYDASFSLALGCMYIVQSRHAATLLPIIQQHVEPGTVIWLDSWATYKEYPNYKASNAIAL